MKKTFSIIFFSLFVQLLAAQNVNIPDVNFLNALINAGVDTNNDSIIQTSEALAVTQISVSSLSIASLTGIEAFTNLTSLACPINNLTSVDLSKNILLLYLDIGGNYQLPTLDLSKNTVLQGLDIIFTGLTTIDLSHNLQLQSLACSGTMYSGLTLNNKLIKLDVSKNLLLTSLSAQMNPQLKSICINPTQFANNIANWTKDSTCVWDTICAPPFTPPAVNTPTTISNYSIPEETQPIIIRCYDMLGNELDINNRSYKGIIIYQYSDGTTKKVVRIE